MEDRLNEAHDLLRRATLDPDTVDLDVAIDLLEADSDTARNVTLKAIGAVAHKRPARVVPVAERVIDTLDDPFSVASSTATMVLMLLAQNHPEAVCPAVPVLIGKLDGDVPQYRFHAAGAIAAVSDEHPERFVEYSDELFDFLVDGPRVESDEFIHRAGLREDRENTIRRQQQIQRRHSRSTREVMASVVAEVAKIAPEACARRLSDIVLLLDDDAVPVRVAALEIVVHIAKNDSAVVEPEIDVLLERLDEDIAPIRLWAVKALGAVGTVEVIGELREIADTDPDEEVANCAATAIDTIGEAT